MNNKYLYIKYQGESNQYLTNNELYYVYDYFTNEDNIKVYVINDNDNVRHFISKDYELIEVNNYL